MKLQTAVKVKPSLNLVLGPYINLIAKDSNSFLQQLEEEAQRNHCITHLVARRPKFFFWQEEYKRDIPAPQSFWDNLMSQLRFELDGIELEIAQAILENIDHKGFFVGDEEQIAKDFGVHKDLVEDVREFIATEIEPVGIASKSYEEFFCIQLREMGMDKPELCQRIVEFIKKGKADGQVKDLLGRLRLRPIDADQSPYTVGSVDIILERDQDDWIILLMDDFVDFSVKEEGDKEQKEKALKWQKVLEIRRTVLRRCAQRIVQRQEGFLLKGEPLKPLKLSQLAEELGISVSLLSRLVSNKYVKTPVGIYPLRFFFKRESKGGYSTEEVLRAIREILQKHPKLSDAEVSLLLKGRGIDISRRTVCKYRKML